MGVCIRADCGCCCVAVGVLGRVAGNDTAYTLKIDVWHVSKERKKVSVGPSVVARADFG